MILNTIEGGRYQAIEPPVYDDYILKALMADECAAKSALVKAKDAFRRSEEGRAEYDPFIDDEPGPFMRAYIDADKAVREAQRALAEYRADQRSMTQEEVARG